MEVDEEHAAAAAHQPPRRHRRIDAAREQAGDAAARRRPAGRRRRDPCRRSRTPRSSAFRHESSARASSRSTCQPRASLIRPPTSRSICGEVSGNRLSARRTDTRNDRGSSGPRSRRISAAMASMSSGARPARAKLPAPKTFASRSRTASPVRAVAEHHLDPPLQRTHLLDVEVGRRLADVPHQPRRRTTAGSCP